MNQPIYRLHNFGFGDHWASFSWLRHVAKATNTRPIVSYMQHGHNFKERSHEIDWALDMAGDDISDWRPMLTNMEPNTDLDGFDIWSCPAVPTRVRWEFCPPLQKTVVYQFDGQSSPEKNPSLAEQDRILSHIIALGYTPIRLGKHLSVKECVQLCSKAALFVGCSSGMQCLAQSVGVPVFILEYALPVITCARQKQFVICKGAEHFIGESRAYLALTEKLRSKYD